MLPKLDGLSLIQRLRDQRIRTPVIILSAKHTVDDRVKGLESGGDDYLTKPFAFSELLARVQALIRRVDRRRRSRRGWRSAISSWIWSRGRVDARGPRDRAAAARVRAARVPDAQRRPGRLEDDDPVARLGLQLRSRHQRRRRAGLPAARPDRQGLRAQDAADRARASAMSSSPPERAAPDARAAARHLVRGDLRRQLAGAHRAHLSAAVGVAAAVRPRDHRVDAVALRDRLPRRRRGRRSPRRSAATRRRPATSRCSCARSARSRISSTSARRPHGGATTCRSSRRRRRGEQTLGDARRQRSGRAARSRLGAAARRHAVPGRQEHGAARPRCSGASA